MSWEKVPSHELMGHPLFGVHPLEWIAQGGPGLLMRLGPLIEQLGAAIGDGVIRALDRKAKTRMTANFSKTSDERYGLMWRYDQKAMSPIPRILF